MAEPENLVIEHLRAIRADMSKMADYVYTLGIEMKALRQQFTGVMTLRDHDHDDIAVIKHRLDRIERRLELAE